MGKFYEDLTSKSNDAFTKGFFGGKPVNIKLKTKPAEKMLLKHKFRIYRTSSLKKDVEVLFMTDAVDDFWVTVALPYKEKEFQSITRSDIDLENVDKAPEENKEEEEKSKDDEIKDVTSSQFESLVNFMKETLGAKVKDVKVSKKLTDSPVCLAVDAQSMDIRMERFLLEQKQIVTGSAKILEINTGNKIIKSLNENLANDSKKLQIQDSVKTLFDLACMLEGEPIEDAKDFSRRLQQLM